MKALTTTNIDQFVKLVQQGVDAWYEAGKLVAAMIDEDRNAVDKICEHAPMLSHETVMAFDRMGRKALHPRLMIASGPGFEKLKRLPYELQEKYLNTPVELLISDGQTLLVDVANLNRSQSDQVFDGRSVRTPAAQRAYLESKAPSDIAPIKSVQVPFEVVAGKLVVYGPYKFTRKEVARLLSDMEN